MQKELTDKQQAFVQEYCNNGFNASQAYKTAYPKCKAGYQQAGSRMLLNAVVEQAIEVYKADKQAKTDYDRTRAEQDYEQVRLLALTKGDYQAANTAIRGKNKLYALETDKVVATSDDQRQLTEVEQAEARRLAGIRLREGA